MHAAGFAPGTRLDRYTLIRRLAVGGMAELYLAQQSGASGFSKIVALKRVLPHLAQDVTFTDMFLREAKLASDLNHPNLAHVLDFGECEGEHYLTMEYVHGPDLLEVLKRAKAPLPLAAALRIVLDVARGLHELHEHRAPDGRPLGLVHRDVSPSNVLVAYDGSVKLTDFGIAKAMDLTSATRTGTFKGKLGHSSPEQARGERIDRRSDVFCLGILLYEVTTGTRAFAGANEFAVLGKVARAAYEAPEAVVEDYPPALSAIVARAMSAAPEDRPDTAADFADELAAFATDTKLAASPRRVATLLRDLYGEAPPITDPEELDRIETDVVAATLSPSAPPSSRQPWLAYALVPLALVLGAAGAWLARAPTEPMTARAALSPFPLVQPQPTPESPTLPEPVAIAAEPEPVAEPARKSTATAPKRTRKRRKPRTKPAAAEPKKSPRLNGALFPPEP